MKLIFILIFFIVFTISQAQSKGLVPSSFSANFEETIIKAGTNKPATTNGKIDYKYPGNFRFEVTSEPKKLLVSNANKSWLYEPPFMEGEKGQVTIQKASSLPLTKVLDALKNGIENSKSFTPKYEGKNLVLVFSADMTKEISVKSVTLQSSKDAKSVQSLREFESIIIENMDGKKSVIRLIDVKEDVPFDVAHFTFNVPDNTRVTTN